MNHQISIFDIVEDLDRMDKSLQRGSGFAGGKIRIYAAALQSDIKDFAEFLKEEYGIGGCTTSDGFLDYNSKGVRIGRWHEEPDECSWSDAAKKIKKLIAMDLYLNEREKEIIKRLTEKHGGALKMPHPRCYYEEEADI